MKDWLAFASFSPLFWALFWLGYGIAAPTVKGTMARNNPVRIVRPDKPILWDGSVTAFVHVQERGEFRLCKIAGIVAVLAFWAVCTALGLHPVAFAIVSPIAMVTGDQMMRVLPFTDYAGHGAELLAAKAEYANAPDQFEVYRKREVEALRGDPAKRGDDIERELARWHWLARIAYALGRW